MTLAMSSDCARTRLYTVVSVKVGYARETGYHGYQCLIGMHSGSVYAFEAAIKNRLRIEGGREMLVRCLEGSKHTWPGSLKLSEWLRLDARVHIVLECRCLIGFCVE